MGIIPSAVLIFVVLGTMMMGLATPTEAGAMGAVGAIVLAAIHSKDFSTTGRKVLIVGVIAGGIGTIIAMFHTESSSSSSLSPSPTSPSSGSASRPSAFRSCAT